MKIFRPTILTVDRCRFSLVNLFVLIGPLGNLLVPSGFPHAFRSFFFVLPFAPFFLSRLERREMKMLLVSSLLLFYILVSSYCIHFTVSHDYASPFFRAMLLLGEYFFTFGVVFFLKKTDISKTIIYLVRLYLYGVFLSLLVGYFLFFGFYLNHLSKSILMHFCVNMQFAYGLLRFSPGSYPNEYGTIMSFALSVLSLLLGERKHLANQIGLSKYFAFLLYCLCLIALFLSITRSAYLSYFISLCYLCLVSKRMRHYVFVLGGYCILILFALKGVFADFLILILTGFIKISLYAGSVGERMQKWKIALQGLSDSPILGKGFGYFFDTHNVYLGLFCELGILGTLLLIGVLLTHLLPHKDKIKKLLFKRYVCCHYELFANRIIVIGCIHIFWFALSNHNMHHHLTWFVFLLLNLYLFKDEANGMIADEKQRESSAII